MKVFLQDLLKERDQNNVYRYSWSRVQSIVSFVYFLVLYTKQTWGTQDLPDVPDGWIFLIGVSSATYLAAKYANRNSSFGISSSPVVYNAPHVVSQANDPNATIIPGPDGPSTLSIEKNEKPNI